MAGGNATPWATLMANCRDAKEVVIAAPYIKVGSLAPVLDRIASTANLVCVSRWTPQDVASGATDLECRALTIGRGGKFLIHHRLHAKYYRFDERVLLGSANLTAAGMNQTAPGNLEILCPPPLQFNAGQFEAELLEEAFPVTDEAFALWNQIAPIPPQFKKNPLDTEPKLEVWKPITRRPEYLWLAYKRQYGEIPSEQQRSLAKQEGNLLGIPPDMNEPEFHNWVKLAMLSSPFVKDVWDAWQQPNEISWETLSVRWGMTKRDAAQAIATTQFWIAHYGLHRDIGQHQAPP